MTYSVPITLLVVGIFALIAVLPRIPLFAKIAVQGLLGILIYKFKSDATFLLPMANSLPMSELFGGDAGMGSFNKYALGVLGPVLGIILSLIFAIISKVLSKKDSE